jgi:UDP-glucose:glycoprotein glucosyltransferase
MGLNLVVFPPSQLYSAELSEDAIASISTYFYDLPSTTSRRNRHVYANNDLRIVNFLDLCTKTGLQSSPESYIYPSTLELI